MLLEDCTFVAICLGIPGLNTNLWRNSFNSFLIIKFEEEKLLCHRRK